MKEKISDLKLRINKALIQITRENNNLKKSYDKEKQARKKAVSIIANEISNIDQIIKNKAKE